MFSESAYIEAQHSLRSARREQDSLRDQLIDYRKWLDSNHFYAASTKLDEILNGHNSQS